MEVIALNIDEVDDIEVCPGEQAEFTAVYNPFYDIEWSNGETATNSSFYSEVGAHWVEVTDGVCNKRVVFSLLENNIPDIDMPLVAEYCEFDSVLIVPQALNSTLFLSISIAGLFP